LLHERLERGLFRFLSSRRPGDDRTTELAKVTARKKNIRVVRTALA